MSGLREAAQQALEAMEEATGVMEVHLDHYFEAMNVLRTALAQPEPTVPSDCADSHQPVAWIHIDSDKPRVKFLEWREDEPGYRGHWIKTPLYAAPQRCPNCASLEAQNTELDRKLAELERE